MTPAAWSKLLDLIKTIIMSPCRTKADADAMNAQLEEIRKEVYARDG